jgi:hypothetical protein
MNLHKALVIAARATADQAAHLHDIAKTWGKYTEITASDHDQAAARLRALATPLLEQAIHEAIARRTDQRDNWTDATAYGQSVLDTLGAEIIALKAMLVGDE